MSFPSPINRRFFFFFFPFVFFFATLLLIFLLDSEIVSLRIKEWQLVVGDSLDSSNTDLFVTEVPFCGFNLLDKQSYHFEQWARRSLNSSQLLSKANIPYSCTLMQYSVERVVSCIDILQKRKVTQENHNGSKKNTILHELHFMFIGDSRIRQQFLYFLKLVPDYDRKADPIEIPKNVVLFHHGDVEVQSKILKLRVSFKWRPIINDTILETLRHWTNYNQIVPPNLIFLGMEVHHMLESNGADFKLYQKNLVELGQVLDELTKVSKVIWLNQYPTIEFYGGTHAHNTYVHSEKVHHYNEAVRRILKKYTSIQIWDSGNPLAQEYIRGCAVFDQREIPRDVFVKEGSHSFINCKSYINCNDYIHTGYVALSQATQLLYNDICNFNIQI